MPYRIPDLNKIRHNSKLVARDWENVHKRHNVDINFKFSQSVRPAAGFGSNLPIKDGDSVVFQCVNGGDVFLALAARLDCDWTVSDIRASSLAHVRKKIESPQFRFERFVEDSLFGELAESGEFKNSDLRETVKIMKGAFSKEHMTVRSTFAEEKKTLMKRNVKYIEADSKCFGFPPRYVDWHFCHEPLDGFLVEPTMLIESLASSRKGLILSFKTEYFPLEYMRIFAKMTGVYGSKVEVRESEEPTLDDGQQKVTYCTVMSTSDLPIIDRKVIRYCSNKVFEKEQSINELTDRTHILLEDASDMSIEYAASALRISEEEVLNSLGRLDDMMAAYNVVQMQSFVEPYL